jgi:hypothetical protein
MITAIAWDNTRAFNKWIESVRLLQQSHGNDPGVILTFLENLPTPMYSANLTTETGGTRDCVALTRESTLVPQAMIIARMLPRN